MVVFCFILLRLGLSVLSTLYILPVPQSPFDFQSYSCVVLHKLCLLFTSFCCLFSYSSVVLFIWFPHHSLHVHYKCAHLEGSHLEDPWSSKLLPAFFLFMVCACGNIWLFIVTRMMHKLCFLYSFTEQNNFHKAKKKHLILVAHFW